MAIIREFDQSKVEGTPLQTIRFSDALMQLSAPGRWAMLTGEGNMNFEALSSILAHSDYAKTLGEFLLSRSELESMLTKLLPAKTTIMPGRAYLSVAQISLAAQSTSLKGPLAMVFADVLSSIMGALRIIAPSVGYVHIEERKERFPTAEMLIEEAHRRQIEEILQGLELKLDDRVKQVSVPVLLNLLLPIFNKVGRELLRVGEYRTYMMDAMALVNIYYDNTLGESERLTESEMRSADLGTLATNATFTLAAFNTGTTRIINRRHEIPVVLSTVMRVLRESKRFKIVSLPEVASTFGIRHVKGPRGARVASVIHSNWQAEHHVQVGTTHSVDFEDSVLAFAPLSDYERAIERVVADTLPTHTLETLAHRASTYLSAIDIKPENYVALLIGMVADDLDYLALTAATDVKVMKHPEEGLFVLYEKTVGDVNINTPTTPVTDRILTSDPLEVLAYSDELEPTSVLKAHLQGIPDSHLAKYLAFPPQGLFSEMHRSVKGKFRVADVEHSVDMTLANLLGLFEQEDVKMVTAPVNRMIAKEHMHVVERLTALAHENASSSEDEDAEYHMSIALKLQLANLLHDMLKPVYASQSGAAMTDAVITRIASSAEKRSERERIYSQLKVHHIRLQIQIWISLVVFHQTGLLPFEDIELIINTLKDGNFYQLMAGSSVN